MTRKSSHTITETITCDVCGEQWTQESEGRLTNDRGCDDLCSKCQEAYDIWKANRRKETYKALK